MTRGHFILIIGPPGVGKTTVVERLLERVGDSVMLTTTTTRKPRRKPDGTMERDGEEYFFATREEFQELIDSGDLLEWMNNYGNLYGSSRSRLEAQLARHRYVFSVIDVKGALRIKEIRPETVAVFMEPADGADCERRVRERHGNDPEELSRRIGNIGTELSYRDAFDWLVVNRDGDLGFVLRSIEAILEDLP